MKTSSIFLAIILALIILGGATWFSRTLKNRTTITPSDSSHPMITLKTTSGDITLELFSDKAPKTVENFIKLAREGFYNGTRFHRVIESFMVQGGDPLSKDLLQVNAWGTGGPGYSFEDEINDEKLVRGVLAMANSGPNTNGSQFFIITAEATPWLDGLHTAFGRVVSGMEVVDAISKVETIEPGKLDRPVQPIAITEVVVGN